MLKKTILKIIEIYQIFVSPHLGPVCRFYPGCSEYSRQAIEKWGLVKGLWLSGKRLLKCHPWGSGGVDFP